MAQPSQIQFKKTGDGSHTLYRADLDETYHSHHGAINESLHVFIEMGLKAVINTGKKEVRLLEVGFGTGLNMLLTALEAERIPELKVRAVSLEPYPIPPEMAGELNYGDLLPNGDQAREILSALHHSPWEEDVAFGAFTLRKTKQRLEDYTDQPGSFDLIYFDAFAPNKQSEVWDAGNLEKCAALLRAGGMLVTYCAQGAFKRGLKAAGLIVENLPGPPGKRFMTRGVKN